MAGFDVPDIREALDELLGALGTFCLLFFPKRDGMDGKNNDGFDDLLRGGDGVDVLDPPIHPLIIVNC